jgi:anti-anti-sigma regulatory factor
MPTTASLYGSMIVLAVEPALAGPEGDDFNRLATEQLLAGGRWFVVDFSRTAYFDSRGLEKLLGFQEQVEAVGGVVKVAGLKGHGRTTFEIVRFDKWFEAFDSLQEAVRSFD